ncbi:MAG: HAD family phosphatase [Anaerolineales bacterium]|nr:HAD family phosphatase [Anaerolineales bacterium]
MNLPTAMLWDLDGVLVDTGEFHHQAWVDAAQKFDFPYSRQFFIDHFGMNNTRFMTLILGHAPNPDFLAEVDTYKETIYREAIRGQAELLPGVADWLAFMHAAGVPQAIGSSAPQANIDALVDELQIRAYFGSIVSAHQLPSKPDPTVFQTAAANLEAEPSGCLVVEDAIAGVEAAKAAKMKCLAVTTTNPADALQQADLIVDRLDRYPVPEFLERLG